MTQRWKQVRLIIAVCWILGGGVALLFPCGSSDAAQAADATAKSPAASQGLGKEADEQAIRTAADDFVKAFNAGDAKAVGTLWALDAEYTDELGQSIQGRAAIEKEYADLFKQNPGATMTVDIESIRFLGSDTAMEKGIAKVTLAKGDATTAARYAVVHAKRDGTWSMVVARDDRYVPESNED